MKYLFGFQLQGVSGNSYKQGKLSTTACYYNHFLQKGEKVLPLLQYPQPAHIPVLCGY